MNVLETLSLAMRSPPRGKLRSCLTALGIIIGVGAVIAMVAIGDGARANVQKVLDSMGTHLLIVLPGSSNSGGARGGFGSQPSLTWDDLESLRTQLPSVRAVAPELRTSTQVFSEDQNWTTSVVGTTPDLFDMRAWTLAQGARFTDTDVEGGGQSTETLSLLLASVAAVSLVMGGIGIMNIMLVSVTERTREIGVRVAVGARPRDILAQFLIETLTLALLGGLIGTAVGLGVAWLLASRLGPIEALRYE